MSVLHPPRPDQHRGIARTRPAYRPGRPGEEALPVAPGRADRELIKEAGRPCLVRLSHLQGDRPGWGASGATGARASGCGSSSEHSGSPPLVTRANREKVGTPMPIWRGGGVDGWIVFGGPARAGPGGGGGGLDAPGGGGGG